MIRSFVSWTKPKNGRQNAVTETKETPKGARTSKSFSIPLEPRLDITTTEGY